MILNDACFAPEAQKPVFRWNIEKRLSLWINSEAVSIKKEQELNPELGFWVKTIFI